MILVHDESQQKWMMIEKSTFKFHKYSSFKCLIHLQLITKLPISYILGVQTRSRVDTFLFLVSNLLCWSNGLNKDTIAHDFAVVCVTIPVQQHSSKETTQTYTTQCTRNKNTATDESAHFQEGHVSIIVYIFEPCLVNILTYV